MTEHGRGSLYLCYFRAIRVAKSQNLELYCKHPLRNICRYFKTVSHTSCADFCGTLRKREEHCSSFPSICKHFYIARHQSWLDETPISTRENKCETKHEGEVGEKKKISDQCCFIRLLGKRHLAGQSSEAAVRWSDGEKIRKQRLLAMDLQHTHLCPTCVQVIILGTYR